jgi:lipoprotein-releasing system permease protein
MNLSNFIARRYLFSKKSHNAINIITAISIIGVTIGTMALIIVLSVFNGFENLVVSLYDSFDSDIEITAKIGKTFSPNETFYSKIKSSEGVLSVTPVIEENALLKYHNKQYIATIKGMDNGYLSNTGLDTMLADGSLLLKKDSTYFAIVGQGVANKLGVNIHDVLSYLTIYVPKRGVQISQLNPEAAFATEAISASGVFAIQQDFDSKYVLVPIEFARRLLNYKEQITSLEIMLTPTADKNLTQKELQALVGDSLLVKNRFQQHEMLYKIMRSEKWAVFLILGFILLIATFNVIGSLTMLIIEKKKDAQVLMSMGATQSFIHKLFLTEGMLISFVGGICGIVLGALICLLQIKFGFVKMPGGGSFVIDSYPVKLEIFDFISVLGTVLLIGFAAAWYPTKKLLRKQQLASAF